MAAPAETGMFQCFLLLFHSHTNTRTRLKLQYRGIYRINSYFAGGKKKKKSKGKTIGLGEFLNDPSTVQTSSKTRRSRAGPTLLKNLTLQVTEHVVLVSEFSCEERFCRLNFDVISKYG